MNERDLFLEALEIDDPGARRAWLDDVCANDVLLRSRMDRLLAFMAQSGGFLESPPPEFAETDDEEQECLALLTPAPEDDCLGLLGPYRVDRMIGRSGMSIVFQGRDPRLNRMVAIKVMAPELAASRSARQRFLREAQAAAAVRHENVVTLFAVEESEELPYLVMEFVEGESLQARLDRTGPLPPEEVVRIGAQVATGLAAAHRQGLVHRDVKPANILLEAGSDHVKITDFGLARASEDVRITRSGLLAGTPQFMSPEQAQGKPVSARSDLFSLGCVLYAMCAGRPPFAGESPLAVLRSVCHDPAPRLRKTNPETPAWLEELVARLLSKDPADRPASADEVVAGMERRDATLGQARRPHRMRPWLAAAAALVLCVAGLGVSDATGVTQLMPTVIRLVTGEGTLVVQVDDPTVKVAINGDELTITGAGIHEVRLKPGSHRVDTQRDGKLLGSDIVTIARGGRELVRVSHETPTSDAPPAPAPSAPSTIDFAAREAELRESIRLHPNVPAYRYHLALNLSDQKRYDEAVGEYRAVLELPGVGRGVRLYLAGTLQKQGKFAEAEEEFREYLLADPNEVAVLSQLAINLATQKKLVELEEIYRTILELEPGKHATRSQLGQLLRQTDRLGESEAELRAVIDERPQDAGAYYQLALTLETAGKWAEAEAAYREHQRISPNDLIRARLASVLRRQGKDAEADADCAKVPPRRCP